MPASADEITPELDGRLWAPPILTLNGLYTAGLTVGVVSEVEAVVDDAGLPHREDQVVQWWRAADVGTADIAQAWYKLSRVLRQSFRSVSMAASVAASVPVVLRSPRRLVLGRLCVAAAVAALAVAGWLVELTWLPRLLIAVAAVHVIQAGYAWAGRVILRPDALCTRGLVIPRRVTWPDVWGWDIRTTLFGKHVRVHRQGRKTSLRLPVPSSSYLIPNPAFDAQVGVLHAWYATHAEFAASVQRPGRGSRRWYPVLVAAFLVAALVLDRPWVWSIGSEGALVTSLPDLCQVAPAAVQAVVGDQPGTHYTFPYRGETRYICVWGVDDNQRQMMFVAIDVFRRLGPFGPIWRAHDAFRRSRSAVDTGGVRASAPFGDESAAADVLSHTYVTARLANVFVEIYSHGPDADVVASAESIAKDVVEHLRVEASG